MSLKNNDGNNVFQLAKQIEDKEAFNELLDHSFYIITKEKTQTNDIKKAKKKTKKL